MSEATLEDQIRQAQIFMIKTLDETKAEMDQIPLDLTVEEKKIKCDLLLNNLFEFAMCGAFPFIQIIDKLKYSEGEAQDEQLVQDFLSFTQDEKTIVVKLMQLICQSGVLTETEDLSNRNKWLDKLMKVNC